MSPMLTEARIRTIASKIAKGVPQTAAAGSLGIPRRTFQNWLAAGRAEDAEGVYLELALAVDEALDKYHASRVIQLHKIGSDDPRVVMWELERRFKGDWGEPDRAGVNVNVNVLGSPEWVELKSMIVDTLRPFPDALEALARRFAGEQEQRRELPAAA